MFTHEIPAEVEEEQDDNTTLNQAARRMAEAAIDKRIKLITRQDLETACVGNDVAIFTMRVRYYIQKGWRFMVNHEHGGLRVLSESERAADAARRCRSGARKVIRAENALKKTKVEKLTSAQRAEHEASVVFVSRQSRALRSARG